MLKADGMVVSEDGCTNAHYKGKIKSEPLWLRTRRPLAAWCDAPGVINWWEKCRNATSLLMWAFIALSMGAGFWEVFSGAGRP